MKKSKHGEAWAAIIRSIRERCKEVGETQSKVADLLGVHRATLGRWLSEERGGKKASIDEMLRYMNVLGVDCKAFFPANEENQGRGVPLVGLAVCGYDYWSKEVRLAVTVNAPAETSPNMFAVVATGDSMRPEGIAEGYIVYCDPDAEPDLGDAVFVRRDNDTMSIKMYRGKDGGDVLLEGWLPPDVDGAQAVYTLRLRESSVTMLAPVIYIKRRA